jgi:GDP-4-dehydro-6-deoxy-D-mannose reductase
MRILVTGATGFVGRWLIRELEAAGHDAVAAPGSAQLDITDATAVSDLVAAVRPDAIAHLAGVAFARDAASDPARAIAVNEGGTRAVVEAASGLPGSVPMLVSGSSEVYGRPAAADLPLREDAPLLADQPYGRSKLAQERIALELGAERGVPVVVTRSFNHTGPGQRPVFVAPALARRILDARRSGSREIVVGNLDVRRDLGDVRDVVRAYRLLIEGLRDGHVPGGSVVNVATGRSVTIRRVLEILSAAAGISTTPRIDPALVRDNDPPEIVGDSAALRRLTGWQPTIPLEQTLADLLASIEAEGPSAG